MINRSYNIGLFLRQTDGTVISIRKKNNQLVTSLGLKYFANQNYSPERPTPKKWKSPISRSKGVFS